MITGKNCYHAYHPACIAMMAYKSTEPLWRIGDQMPGTPGRASTSSVSKPVSGSRRVPRGGRRDRQGLPDRHLGLVPCVQSHLRQRRLFKMAVQALETIDDNDSRRSTSRSRRRQAQGGATRATCSCSRRQPRCRDVVKAKVPNTTKPRTTPAGVAPPASTASAASRGTRRARSATAGLPGGASVTPAACSTTCRQAAARCARRRRPEDAGRAGRRGPQRRRSTRSRMS